jgi:hypothetical protein
MQTLTVKLLSLTLLLFSSTSQTKTNSA